MSTFNKWFHTIVIAITIIHVSVCSLFFEQTSIWKYLTYLCEFNFIIVLCQYIIKIKSVNSIERLSIIYFVFILVVSILYGLDFSNINTLFGRALEIATVIMIFRLNQDNPISLLFSAAITLSIAVYVNAYYLSLFPDGFPNPSDEHPFYFLGTNYNQIGPKIVMAYMFTAILFEKYRFLFVNMLLLTIVGIWTLLLVDSMTSTVAFILLIIVLFISKKAFLKKTIAYGLVFFIIFFQLFVVFIGSSINSSLITDFIDFIGKDNTFTGRTELWGYSSGYFLDSPIWGHGYISSDNYAHSGYFHGKQQGSHNYIYNTLHKGGIILLLLVFSLFKKGYSQIKRYLNYNSAFAIVFSSLAFFLMMLFEYYEALFVFFLIILMYYYPSIHQQLEMKK